jgi:hypothetical protein
VGSNPTGPTMRELLIKFGLEVYKIIPDDDEISDWIDEINDWYDGDFDAWAKHHKEIHLQESKF